MIWQDSVFLWFLLIVPFLIALVWWRGKGIKRIQDQYFDRNLFQSLRKGFWETGNSIKTALMITGFVFIIISLAGPKIGTEVREVNAVELIC